MRSVSAYCRAQHRPESSNFIPWCTYSRVLTCGENSLDHFAPQGSVQRLEFHRVLGGWAQLRQAVGSCLGV